MGAGRSKTLKKINKLIEDICRNGNEGIGKPEALVEILLGIGAGALTIRIGLSIKLMKIMFLYWLVDIIIVISKNLISKLRFRGRVTL